LQTSRQQTITGSCKTVNTKSSTAVLQYRHRLEMMTILTTVYFYPKITVTQ